MLVAVFVVAFAFWQATRPPARATQADIAAAQALKGQCLRRQGGTKAAPVYSPTPVSCQLRRRLGEGGSRSGARPAGFVPGSAAPSYKSCRPAWPGSPASASFL